MDKLNATDYVINEILESHALMTKAQVPAYNDAGERLSLSERVKLLVLAFTGLALASAAITKAQEGYNKAR